MPAGAKRLTRADLLRTLSSTLQRRPRKADGSVAAASKKKEEEKTTTTSAITSDIDIDAADMGLRRSDALIKVDGWENGNKSPLSPRRSMRTSSTSPTSPTAPAAAAAASSRLIAADTAGIMDDMNGFLLTPYARAVEVFDLRHERSVDTKVAKFLLMDYCLQMLKAYVDDDISALLKKDKHLDDLKVFGLWVSLMKVLTGDPIYEDSIEKIYALEKKTVPFMVFDGPRLIVRVNGRDISGAMDLYLKTANAQADTSFNMPFFIGSMLYTTLITNPGSEAEWEQRWQNMVRELSRAVTLDFLLGYIENVRPDYRTARQIHNFMWNSPLVEKTRDVVERASHTIGPVGYIYKKVHSWLAD